MAVLHTTHSRNEYDLNTIWGVSSFVGFLEQQTLLPTVPRYHCLIGIVEVLRHVLFIVMCVWTRSSFFGVVFDLVSRQGKFTLYHEQGLCFLIVFANTYVVYFSSNMPYYFPMFVVCLVVCGFPNMHSAHILS